MWPSRTFSSSASTSLCACWTCRPVRSVSSLTPRSNSCFTACSRVTSACALVRAKSFVANSSFVAACSAVRRTSASRFFWNRSRSATALAKSPATCAAISGLPPLFALRTSSCARSSFTRASASCAAASFTSNSSSNWPFFTCCPSVTETFFTNVSRRARITYGATGSTFPLLLIDETRFSRIGATAEILGTGFRPLSSSSPYASTPASTR